MAKEYVKLSPAESLYFSFLRSNELFNLDKNFTGLITEDWGLWLKHYKLLNS